ncbi:MAG: hypothetical protein IPJ78_10310 [Gemmatimonadetes bacterium]|nr:hypothetical protein [Gemmatimonadota bacterium]
MTDYADTLKEHLSEYKARHWPGSPDGIYRGNGRAYAHVLPESLLRENILASLRDEFWEYFEANRRELALHTDFHHLNSSQALTFNLFFPWMREDATRGPLFDALGLRAGAVSRWHFEWIHEPAERTSFDVFAEYADGARLFVEVKLTEAHFGMAQADESHLRKRMDYLPKLAEKVRPEFLEEAHFLLHYQLFRNLSHVDPARGDRLVLLVPEANAFTWSQANGFLDWLLPAARASVRVVPTEALVARLWEMAPETGGSFVTHVAQLREKYLPVSSPPAPQAPA